MKLSLQLQFQHFQVPHKRVIPLNIRERCKLESSINFLILMSELRSTRWLFIRVVTLKTPQYQITKSQGLLGFLGLRTHHSNNESTRKRIQKCADHELNPEHYGIRSMSTLRCDHLHQKRIHSSQEMSGTAPPVYKFKKVWKTTFRCMHNAFIIIYKFKLWSGV